MGCSSTLFMETQLALHTSFNYKDKRHRGLRQETVPLGVRPACTRRTPGGQVGFTGVCPESASESSDWERNSYVHFEGACNPLEPGTDQDGLHPGLLLEFSPHAYARISEELQLLEVE